MNLLLVARPNSQLVQNARADADDLSRMQNIAMVKRFARAGLLTKVPSSTRHYYVYGVSSNYRYLRPWAKLFMERLSRQFHARFSKRLRYTSLVRTVAYQKSLARRNGNAAPAVGPRRSTHLTGTTLDISKRDLKPAHLQWLRKVLYGLHRKDVIHAVEEFRQPTFHVMVHKSYVRYVQVVSKGTT